MTITTIKSTDIVTGKTTTSTAQGDINTVMSIFNGLFKGRVNGYKISGWLQGRMVLVEFS